MEQVENTLQPTVLQPQQAVVSSASYGKFKNAEELLRAYLNLEAEFTRKSQKLKSLIKGKNDDFENLTNEVINFKAIDILGAGDCENTQKNLSSSNNADNVSCNCDNLPSSKIKLQEKSEAFNSQREKVVKVNPSEENCDIVNSIEPEICEKIDDNSIRIGEDCNAKSTNCCCENSLKSNNDDKCCIDKGNLLETLEENCDDVTESVKEINSLAYDNLELSQENTTESFMQKMPPIDSRNRKDLESSSYVLGVLEGANIDSELKDELKNIAKNNDEGKVVLALAYKISAMKNKLSDNELLKEVVNSNSVVKQHVIKNYIEDINSLNLPNLSVGKYPSFTAQKAYKPKSIAEAGNIAKGLF